MTSRTLPLTTSQRIRWAFMLDRMVDQEGPPGDYADEQIWDVLQWLHNEGLYHWLHDRSLGDGGLT